MRQSAENTAFHAGACRFFLLGAVLGGMVAARGASAMGGELRRYLEGYLAPAHRGRALLRGGLGRRWSAFSVRAWRCSCWALPPSAWRSFRRCAAQGFLYAYSLLCFASGLGQDGFFLLPVLFVLRLMLVLPCTLLLGSAAWETSRGLAALSVGGGKRAKGVTYGKRYWSRFGIACVCLFFGAALGCGSFHASCRFCCADLTEGGVPDGGRLSEAL